MQFGFNTLKKPAAKTIMALQPKGMHDEMNSTNFDEFGRMQATLGMEAQPATPMTQNVTLFPFSNPATELLNGTNLPKQDVTYDAGGNAVSDIQIQPMSDAADGTQIWRITHNGVDTHPVHFHLYDVQILDRVTWDNIIIRTEPEELGWKDTVRISPLEDTIVALRPIIPETPWEVENSIRMLNPADPEGSTAGFNNIDPQGNPTNPIVNQLVNYGWAYVWHCHILSHEEMDMMRPQSLAMPPVTPDGLVFAIVAGHVKLTFNDNSINETSFLVQRTSNGTTWQNAGTIASPLDLPNVHEQRTFTDPRLYNATLVYQYRVVARNTVGYGAEFPTETAQSTSETIATGTPPAAPTGLTATAAAGPVVRIAFTDTATDETGFWLQRATDGGAFTTIATLPVKAGTGAVTYNDATVAPDHAYDYQVCAVKGAAASAWDGPASVVIPAIPVAPAGLTATLQAGPQALLQWTDRSAGEDYFVLERALHGSPVFTAIAQPAPNATSYIDAALVAGTAYDYRVAAVSSISGASAYSPIATLDVAAKPLVPTGLAAVVQTGPKVSVTWTAPIGSVVTGYTVQRSVNGSAFVTVVTLGAATTSYVDLHTIVGSSYSYQVAATNLSGVSDWAGPVTVDVVAPAAPSNLVATIARTAAGPDAVGLTWVDNAYQRDRLHRPAGHERGVHDGAADVHGRRRRHDLRDHRGARPDVLLPRPGEQHGRSLGVVEQRQRHHGAAHADQLPQLEPDPDGDHARLGRPVGQRDGVPDPAPPRRRHGVDHCGHHQGQRDQLRRRRPREEHHVLLPDPRAQRHGQLAVVGHRPCEHAAVRAAATRGAGGPGIPQGTRPPRRPGPAARAARVLEPGARNAYRSAQRAATKGCGLPAGVARPEEAEDGRAPAADHPAPQADAGGARGARQRGPQARAALLARRLGAAAGQAGPGRPARGAGGRPGRRARPHPLRAHARLSRHVLPRRRPADGLRPLRLAGDRLRRPAVRRRAPDELRPVPVARAPARLRHQRLRRDPAGAVGVGRQAAGGQLRDRRRATTASRPRRAARSCCTACAPTARACSRWRRSAPSTSGTRGSRPT